MNRFLVCNEFLLDLLTEANSPFHEAIQLIPDSSQQFPLYSYFTDPPISISHFLSLSKSQFARKVSLSTCIEIRLDLQDLYKHFTVIRTLLKVFHYKATNLNYPT